jgi:hypothetical protein
MLGRRTRTKCRFADATTSKDSHTSPSPDLANLDHVPNRDHDHDPNLDRGLGLGLYLVLDRLRRVCSLQP